MSLATIQEIDQYYLGLLGEIEGLLKELRDGKKEGKEEDVKNKEVRSQKSEFRN